jgi:hypothetical protein
MAGGIGRITGPLLKDNLVRNGVDLSFETDLLYLDVNTNKIGIKTDSPGKELFIEQYAKTIDLIVDDYITANKIEIDTSSNIFTSLDKLYLDSQQSITAPGLKTDKLLIDNNTVVALTANTDIEIRPTGQLVVENNTDVYGSIHATGNITIGGDVVFGNDDDDSVDFNADVRSDINPDLDSVYNLGEPNKRWKELYAQSVTTGLIVADELITPADIEFNLRFENSWFVSINGSNSNVGDHQNGPFRNISYALSRATAGDTVFIFPGTYTEIFPLTVPAGVSVVGFDIRSTIIKPTELTNSKDAFLLNGETIISDITVKDYFYNSTDDTGYGFRFAPNFTVTSRSPYIQNVTVITKESNGLLSPAEIYVDPLGLAGSYSSNSVAVDQINYTQSQVESWIGKQLVAWAGETNPVTFYEVIDAIDEPLDPGYVWRIVLDRDLDDPGEGTYQFSIYPNVGLTSIVGTAGYAGSTDYSRSFLKSTLPPSFNTTVTEFWTCQIGESLNIVDSIEEDPLNSNLWRVNFKAISTPTNGLPIFTSPSGSATIPAGKGALIDGSVAQSSSNDASMLFHSVTFITPGVDAITMTNGVRVEWLNSFTYFANRGLYSTQGSLGFASEGNIFGSEVRSIGSANVYGNCGVVADGADTLIYLINHNFGYIGSGLDSSNDNTLTNQECEVVELNGGKIYYTSQSQDGDFRIGDYFLVDFDTGSVSFETSNININGASSIVFEGDDNRTFITADFIETGDFNLSGNTIKTLTRDFNIESASEVINFLDDVDIDKNLLVRGDFSTDGTITFGNGAGDTISFNTDFTQNLNPKQDNIYDIGSQLKIWKDIYLTSAVLQDINFSDSVIETTQENSNLVLFGNGNGSVIVEDISFKDNSISAVVVNANLEITPTEDNSLVISGNDAVVIPRTTSNLNLTGELRYNTANSQFEGYDSALVTLGGIYSQDKQTNVLVHPTNDVINFTANNIRSTFIDEVGLNTAALTSGNLSLNNNILSTVSNADLEFVADSVNLNDLIFTDNNITAGTDQNIVFNSLGLGYVAFTGTGAVVIPSGDVDTRPDNPITGNTRYNHELGYMEVYNGSEWVPASGTGELSTFEYANEQTTLWALVVG